MASGNAHVLAVSHKQSILRKYRTQFKLCNVQKQSKACMKNYPVRTDQQLSLLIKSLRKARGLTQADLAQAQGVTQQAASALERNPSTASVGRLLRTLSAMGVELVLREKEAESEAGPETRNKPSSVKGGTKPKQPFQDW
jgi:HTH-type transcriptional regulator/antitoxin HipB